MADELGAPLGRKRRAGVLSAAGIRYWPFARIGAFVLVAILGAVAARIVLVDDPEGGRPTAEIAIAAGEQGNAVAGDIARAEPGAEPRPAGDGIVDITPLAGAPGGPQITTIGDGAAIAGDPVLEAVVATRNDFGAYPALLEETGHGPIPRVGPDGLTPFSAYARPSLGPAAAGGRPLVAVVVTGLGLNEAGTIDAIERLPDNITLAFAPYGRTLSRTIAAAQAGGHEILLEVPLEPFDYPETDPGPQTLLVGQPPRANLDRLYWLMSRFGGYAGVINNMGARFTASAADLGPVMEELGTRGLGYLDDGSSNRSLSAQLASGNAVPYARADLMLDDNPSRAAILEALEALADSAVRNGHAVGVVSALPISIATVAEWARGAEAEGLALVPVSAVMAADR